MNPYNSLKGAWHLDKIAALRDGKHIKPTHVQLIISDLCNQNCGFCSYRMDGGFSTENFADADGNKNPKRMIPTAKCIEILSDCEALGVEAVQFTGGGEPTVHPDHIEIFQHAHELGLKTGLVTNGVVLRDPETYANFTWIRISLDAGDRETYETTRQSKSWSHALENIREIAKLKGPLVGVGFVVTKHNWRGLVTACLLAQNLGAAYIRLSAIFSADGISHYDGIYQQIVLEIAKAKWLASDDFQVIDLMGDRIGDLEQGPPVHKFCGYQRFTVYVGGDQKVYRCCTTSYTTHGEIGDLKTQTFRQWWEQAFPQYDGFDARTCKVCQFNNQNRALAYLADPHPQHVEFV